MSGAQQSTGGAAAPPSPGRAELLAVILYNFLCVPICVGMSVRPRYCAARDTPSTEACGPTAGTSNHNGCSSSGPPK